MTKTAALTAGLALTAFLAAASPAASAAAPAEVSAAVPTAGRPGTAPDPRAGGMTWAVRPVGPKGPSGRDYFVYNASPGQTIKDEVAISNLSDRTLTFRVYATDAFNTADGSFALLTADRQPTDVGTWVKFDRGVQRVKAGRTVRVPFTLTVPHQATPGDHGGGVIASITQQETDAKGRLVNVDRRVAARIYLRVKGPVTPSLQISDLRAEYSAPPVGSGRMKVTYTVRNTGNIRVTALARIRAQGPFGLPLGEQAARKVPELLPGNSYTFSEELDGILPAGRLTSSIRLSPTDAQSGAPLAARPIIRKSSIWNIPWLPLTAVLLLLAAVLYARRRRSGYAR